MFRPLGSWPREAATRVCVKTQVSGTENAKPTFRVRVFLRGLTASVKAPEYGPQCPFDCVEVWCIAICVYIVGIIEINAHDNGA